MRALDALYRRHGGAVRTVLLRTDPSRVAEQADDLCQETFLTFLDTLHRYRHDGRLRSWLMGIALHKARSSRRRWWRRFGLRSQGGMTAAGVAPPSADVASVLEDRQTLEHLLAKLPAPQREALVLVTLEGLSVGEAAQVLGVSENAVSTRLYRARQALQESR